MRRTITGFTIVELLIVIVVVAILAALSLVVYNGIQDRARYVQHLSSLQQMKKAIEVYHAQNGEYPVATSWQYSCNFPNDPMAFIPGIDQVVQSIPVAPCSNESTPTSDSWLYSSNGIGYKLLYIRPANPTYHARVPQEMRDYRWTAPPGYSWGYWTPDYETR